MGKKVNFDKVIKMIEELVAALKKEQEDDDNKKEYCVTQIDQLEDLSNMISETTDSIATTAEEIEALEDGIKKLDKDVAEATDTRKEENEDYTALMESDTAAK